MSSSPAATPRIDDTHDAKLQSWVESANDPATDFPIQNLPLASFEARHDNHSHAHYATIIGDQVLDVSLLMEAGFFDDQSEESELADALQMPAGVGLLINANARRLWRRRLQSFLRSDSIGGQKLRRLREKALRPLSETTLIEPVAIYNYTDFYASIHHATTVGTMFRPDNPLLPNYKWVPIGYHGRASSIRAGATEVVRPRGQQSPPDTDPKAAPSFGPCKMLDYELELGCVIGRGNHMGAPISIAQAREHIFGLCIVNDWSARDVQKWEYQPLGPFLAKNFATTISPAIVTIDALEPFRCAAYERPSGDPQPLEYLSNADDRASGGFDVTLEVFIESAEMKKRGLAPHRLSKGNFRDMYWTFAQMLTHHTSNGCNMMPGDLIASGTISGKGATERGCMLELTWVGNGPDGKALPRKAIELPSGETRTFLADGDTVIMRGYCERDGFRRIGFGECRGTIAPATGK